VTIEIVFETHSWSVDNDQGVATGWNHGRLSTRGEALARQLGERRRGDGIAAVFTSDLFRAVQTTAIAFEGSDILTLHDWRLRECDYGDLNGASSSQVHAAVPGLGERYPGGESWLDAMNRVSRFLDDLPLRWSDSRVLVIGHVATLWGFEHWINGVPLSQIRSVMDPWREGWEFRFVPPPSPAGTIAVSP
jgi:2,3-bisphosphoglycerate-dependent phosphoglycerate mutase